MLASDQEASQEKVMTFDIDYSAAVTKRWGPFCVTIVPARSLIISLKGKLYEANSKLDEFRIRS